MCVCVRVFVCVACLCVCVCFNVFVCVVNDLLCDAVWCVFVCAVLCLWFV